MPLSSLSLATLLHSDAFLVFITLSDLPPNFYMPHASNLNTSHSSATTLASFTFTCHSTCNISWYFFFTRLFSELIYSQHCLLPNIVFLFWKPLQILTPHLHPKASLLNAYQLICNPIISADHLSYEYLGMSLFINQEFLITSNPLSACSFTSCSFPFIILNTQCPIYSLNCHIYLHLH